MTTTSHAFFTYAFLPTGMDAVLAVVGSVLPDIPFLVGTPYCVVRKTGFRKEAIDAAKDVPLIGFCLRAGHSLLVCLLAAVLAWCFAPVLLPLVCGWIGHNVADFFTHHGEAHAHFYPFSEWRYRSPISYYEWDHHAAKFMVIEYGLAALILISWARHETLTATLAAMLAHPLVLVALLGAGGAVWVIRSRRREAARLAAPAETDPMPVKEVEPTAC